MGDKELFLNYIRNLLNVHIDGLHGLDHWQRVEKIGEFIAKSTAADSEVLKLFAYTHDLGRENDDEDPEHGFRSAEIVKDLYQKKIINLTTEQYDKLIYACSYHMITLAVSDDITIQACWDSDRLDLWRDNIEPDPNYLYTAIAKKPETISWAKSLSYGSQ